MLTQDGTEGGPYFYLRFCQVIELYYLLLACTPAPVWFQKTYYVLVSHNMNDWKYLLLSWQRTHVEQYATILMFANILKRFNFLVHFWR